MRSGITLTLFMATLMFAANAFAQDTGIYSGRGIPDSMMPTQEVKKSRWPKLFDFSKDDGEDYGQAPFSKRTAARMPFENFKANSNSQSTDSSSETKSRRGLSELFQKRDPDRPTFFEQMNAKSKTLFDRTTSWAQRKNQPSREKKFGTWDAITRRSRAKADGVTDPSPARPPIRSTELDEPGIRY
jgi:hypothetical protein